MTSISSSLTSSQYQYKSTLTLASVSDADDFSDSSSSSTTTSASTAASSDSSSTEDQSLITAAQTLLSQMMMMMLNGQSSDSTTSSTSGSVATTASSTDQTSTSSSSDPISAMDTNGDGSVSEAEFVAARPSDVSADQASSLFESFDSDNTGSLTDDQLSQDMQANGPSRSQGTQPSDSDLSDIFTSMDTNGDGAVSEAEFVAARPSDLSEDQASSLFDSLDTSQSGSLSESQFASNVKAELSTAQQPPQMPDFSNLFSGGFSDSTTEDLLTL